MTSIKVLGYILKPEDSLDEHSKKKARNRGGKFFDYLKHLEAALKGIEERNPLLEGDRAAIEIFRMPEKYFPPFEGFVDEKFKQKIEELERFIGDKIFDYRLEELGANKLLEVLKKATGIDQLGIKQKEITASFLTPVLREVDKHIVFSPEQMKVLCSDPQHVGDTFLLKRSILSYGADDVFNLAFCISRKDGTMYFPSDGLSKPADVLTSRRILRTLGREQSLDHDQWEFLITSIIKALSIDEIEDRSAVISVIAYELGINIPARPVFTP